MPAGGNFDPETVSLLREVLEGAWATLSPHQQAQTSRSALASRILRYAAQGERDPIRLRACALPRAYESARHPGWDDASARSI
jgi:hypothetical protein